VCVCVCEAALMSLIKFAFSRKSFYAGAILLGLPFGI